MNLSFESNCPLNIKQAIFEHFVFPYKVNPQSLSQINSAYITLEQFKDLTARSLQGQDSEVLFIFHQMAVNGEPIYDKRPVEVKSLSVFLGLQSFTQVGRHSMFENVNITDVKYQERIQKQQNLQFSPLNSPRAKTMRMQNQQSEMQQITQFVKSSLKDLLTLIRDNEEHITATEFNYLGLFLQSQFPSISQVLFERTTKLSTKMVQESLNKLVQCSDQIQMIQGFTKSVTIKQKVDENLKIIQCDDSMIFIDCSLKTLSIQQCTNCIIYVSAVKLVTSISSCEKTTVCVASNFLRVCNSVDMEIHYFGSYAPILYGDCRNITLAPHTGNVAKLLERLRESNIPITKQNRDRFTKPIIMGSSRIDWTLLPVDEVSRLSIPEEPFGCIDSQLILECNFDIERMSREITDKKVLSQPINQEKTVLPLLAPPEYIKAMYDRIKQFQALQMTLNSCAIKDELMKGLQNAIQGNFKEWLVSTGNIKGINDLVKLIDQDQ